MRSNTSVTFAAGQLWEIRGWGKQGLFLLLERRVGTYLDRDGYERPDWQWLALCVDTGRAIELWEDFADDPQYASRVA